MEKDLILRELYYYPKTGFRSAPHLLELAKEEDKTFTLKEVKEWLEKQNTFSKYKSFNRPSYFRHTMVRYLGEQVQIDLIFLEKHNDRGYHVILNCIEILSRFAFARAMKTKSGKETVENLKSIFSDFKERFHQYPHLIQADEGVEFYNNDMKKYLKEIDATLFSSNSERKATIVERFNRTIKEKIKKLHDSRGSHEWVDDLQDIVHNYNTQEHRSIGMRPIDVNQSNQNEVWVKLYGHIMHHIKDPKFKVGDKVRVLHFLPLSLRGEKYAKYFRKKYPELFSKDRKYKIRDNAKIGFTKEFAPFSEEIFVIDKVLFGDPIVYKLYSEEAEVEILGKFYEQELSRVRDK